jgi:ADP-ribose pyrophosphatase YjhB (NUDIX family)
MMSKAGHLSCAAGARDAMDGAPMEPARLLGVVQRLWAIAQAGITYHNSTYDLERYEELMELSATLMRELTDEPHEKILRAFASETGYATPKVDVRVVVFRGTGEVLLVQERADHDRWTLPGGWADVGYSPFEVAVKEAREETGLVVRPVRLLALLDKRKHAHPPHPWHAYKAFIHCEVEGGELRTSTPETSGARWFRAAEFRSIELSTDRATVEQLESLMRYAADPALPALCD